MSEYQVLAQIGLSKKAIECYETIFNNGGLNAPRLAEKLGLPRTGLYRILKQLETKGFVVSLKVPPHPAYFFAEPLNKALEAYALYQKWLLRELVEQQGEILIKRSGRAPN